MADFGTALSCTDDLDPLGRLVAGEDVLLQSLYRRLTTARGTLITDDDYGLDVRSFLGQAFTASALKTIEGRIRFEAEKDERVEKADVEVTAASDGQTLTGSLVAYTGEGPFRLVFEITADTVSLLKE